MNKSELIDALSASSGMTKTDSKKMLDAFINATSEALKKGEKISLIGFGTFAVAKREARTGRNPQTGKTMKFPAKKYVKFKPGATLSEQVNSK